MESTGLIKNYISLCVQPRGAKIRLYVLCELASRDCQQTGKNAVKSASIPEIHTPNKQSMTVEVFIYFTIENDCQEMERRTVV